MALSVNQLDCSLTLVIVVTYQMLMEDEPEKYQTHFSEYIKRGIEPDDMEGLYKKVHAAIRADPTFVKSTKEPPKEHKRYGPQVTCIHDN